MSDTQAKPIAWYVIGDDRTYLVAGVLMKYPEPYLEEDKEYKESYEELKAAFHNGTPVHAVRISEKMGIKGSSHK